VRDGHVSFGSKGYIRAAKSHVRFIPESGHVRCNQGCPLWANSGHLASLARHRLRYVVQSCSRRNQWLAFHAFLIILHDFSDVGENPSMDVRIVIRLALFGSAKRLMICGVDSLKAGSLRYFCC
jgi:hypothetical protein